MPTCKSTKPSKRQALILNHIRTSLQDRGFPPSIRELCAAVGLSSSSTVHSHLTALERKGFIRREPGQPRSTALVEPVIPSTWRDRLKGIGLEATANHEDVVRTLIHGPGGMNCLEEHELAHWSDERVGAGAWVARCMANPASEAGGILLEAIMEARKAAA